MAVARAGRPSPVGARLQLAVKPQEPTVGAARCGWATGMSNIAVKMYLLGVRVILSLLLISGFCRGVSLLACCGQSDR